MSEWVTISNGSEPTASPESESAAEIMKTPTVGPELMSTGTYAIYKTISGGWHIAYQPNDVDHLCHFEIPAIAVQMFEQVQNGEGMPSPMEMVKKMLAARGGLSDSRI